LLSTRRSHGYEKIHAMGHRYGAYSWQLYQAESGAQLLIRPTGVTDSVKGTQYITEGNVPIWLKTRTPALEAPSGKYPTDLAVPTGLAVVSAITGGTLTNAHGAYGYRVAAESPSGGITLACAEVEATIASGTTGKNTLSWTALSGVPANYVSYVIFGRTPAGELEMATVAGTVLTFVDTGAITPSGALPGSDTSSGTSFAAKEDINFDLLDNGIPWLESLTVPNF
jgi:hypothetical protein